MRKVAAVVLEETHARCRIARLEEADDLREQGEGAWVIVGADDEPEHLDLGFDGRAVVGEHVDPIVLREQWWGAPRSAGKHEPSGVVKLHDFPAERPLGQVSEGLPPFGELLVTNDFLPRVVERLGRVAGPAAACASGVPAAAPFAADARETGASA